MKKKDNRSKQFKLMTAEFLPANALPPSAFQNSLIETLPQWKDFITIVDNELLKPAAVVKLPFTDEEIAAIPYKDVVKAFVRKARYYIKKRNAQIDVNVRDKFDPNNVYLVGRVIP